MELAIRLTKKTLALNDAMDFAYALLGYIYLHRRQYEKAIMAGERAIALNPNGRMPMRGWDIFFVLREGRRKALRC